ncbi:MAG: IMP cyclohydrolase [Clostridia bacterium]|nr:IMP cyclohydrolase [Clostridia bacterium]
MTKHLTDLLRENAYPGRGIALGTSQDGKHAVIVYFIMGRSENSRNRVFVTEGAGIRTQAFDEAKLQDPSLVIYAPVRVWENRTVVTNGDQTDTVFDTLVAGGSFEEALRTRTFEPDAPNYTPRISGLVTLEEKGYSAKMSILKSDAGDGSRALRFFYEYPQLADGTARFIHTYRCDGNPIPSFEGEPEIALIDGDIDTFTEKVWQALNGDNKVSLFVRYLSLEDGTAQTRIVNKNV